VEQFMQRVRDIINDATSIDDAYKRVAGEWGLTLTDDEWDIVDEVVGDKWGGAHV